MDNTKLIAEARAKAAEPMLGKSQWRELDKSIAMIRRLADALEAAEAEKARAIEFWKNQHGQVVTALDATEAELTRRDTVIAAVEDVAEDFEVHGARIMAMEVRAALAAAPVSLEAAKAETKTEWAQADAGRSGVPVAVVQQLHDAGWAYVLNLAGVPAWIQPSPAAVSTLRRRPVSGAGDDRG